MSVHRSAESTPPVAESAFGATRRDDSFVLVAMSFLLVVGGPLVACFLALRLLLGLGLVLGASCGRDRCACVDFRAVLRYERCRHREFARAQVRGGRQRR